MDVEYKGWLSWEEILIVRRLEISEGEKKKIFSSNLYNWARQIAYIRQIARQ